MNNTVKNIKNSQDKQMMDTIALMPKAETHKKHSDVLLKNQMKEAINGGVLPKIEK